MKTCARCLLTGDTFNIAFDERGVCNHCTTYDRHVGVLGDFERLRPLLLERVERARGRSGYQALVGLSGGKDSSYVAYRLVVEHGLRVLLMTYDNGFLSEPARENITRVVQRLGQDHVFCTPSPAMHRSIYRSSVRWLGIPCPGCTFPGFLHAIKLATDHDIPLLVHGRSRAQMFKGLVPGASDPFLSYLDSNLMPYDAERARAFVLATARQLRRLLACFAPGRALRAEAAALFHPDLDHLAGLADPPEFVGAFLYEPYDEEHIKRTLEQELGWRRPPRDDLMGHEDCTVHPAAVYLYTSNYGFPILRQELSTMIREGHVTRADALARLAQETAAHELAAPAMATLEAMTGLELDRILASSRRTRRVLAALRHARRLRHAVLGRRPLSLPPRGPDRSP